MKQITTQLIHHNYKYLATRLCTAILLAWIFFGNFTWQKAAIGGIFYILVAAVETA